MLNLLPVKPFQETLNAGMCGPASLKMVLAFYGIEAEESDLAIRMHASADLGVTAEDVVRVVQEFGLEASIRNKASFDDIGHLLEHNVPPIVDWFTSGRHDYPEEIAVPDGHYSVVVGLDDTHIYLQDPEIGGMRKLTRDAFERVWFDFDGEFITPEKLIIRQLLAVYPKKKELN